MGLNNSWVKYRPWLRLSSERAEPELSSPPCIALWQNSRGIHAGYQGRIFDAARHGGAARVGGVAARCAGKAVRARDCHRPSGRTRRIPARTAGEIPPRPTQAHAVGVTAEVELRAEPGVTLTKP